MSEQQAHGRKAHGQKAHGQKAHGQKAHGQKAPGDHVPEDDLAPGEDGGDPKAVLRGVRGYLIGLVLATVLTAASFWAAGSGLIYGPGVPVALIALAVAQMGVHLVFFLHVTTGPDNTNNILALAFGVLIVALVLVGSLWIMAHLDHNIMPMDEMMRMQR